MRFILTLMSLLSLTGCAMTPYKELNLDTTTNFRSPIEGKSGIYVYQWKTGIFGAALDVDFEITGFPEISLNTGEYAYIEYEPGHYEYKSIGGLFQSYIPVDFEANKNYFFRAYLSSASDHAYLVRDQIEIDDTKKNILEEWYEPHTLD